MQPDFSLLLDKILGPRKVFHHMECEICGYDLIYYQHPNSEIQIGVACEGCNYVKKFDFETDEKR